MHARLVRSAVVAVAAAGTLTWAPAASAQPSEPTPSASAAPAETPAPDAGSVEITAKDTAGDMLAGAAFLLLDSAGQEAGRGKTDAQGKLAFPDLEPGVYRLKETASGSPLHEGVADQDVIVTPGATTRLTITDPFKAAKVFLQAKDDKTGKLLPGATVNIGTGDSTLLTLTTSSKGTASGELPVSPEDAVLGQGDQSARRLRPLQAVQDVQRGSRRPGDRDRHQRQDRDRPEARPVGQADA